MNIQKNLIALVILNFHFLSLNLSAQTYQLADTTRYSEISGYGYDFVAPPAKSSKSPFFFSVKVPDGNYLVTVKLGNKTKAGITTVRAESRRLFIQNCVTRKGEFVEKTFVVNKRTPRITDSEKVKIKEREKTYLNWDDKLTLEFNGDLPMVETVGIKAAHEGTVQVFLCGNSTVVDQNDEPWASWGQMIPAFFDTSVAVVNLAESGESATSFIASNRLKKAISLCKKGDYILVEFGHNDEKITRAGSGAYFSFMTNLKIFVDEARAKGANPVLVTPTARRQFESNGNLKDTHGEYDDAVRFLAEKENVPLIDLTAMTTTMYEALGTEKSKKLLVHYPANTFPNQSNPLADNTHFSTFGAYQTAKCVAVGLQKAVPALALHLTDSVGFNPAFPDDFDSFKWNLSPFFEKEKPDGK
ncbi:MAG: rhamnogalacturonan acetylesterase [Bacteroidales bacterium]|jgi:lysophospholipase L1-like esterase|nr:rhamnogalacturonan acetylesterase [Bacteroidales bacterium]